MARTVYKFDIASSGRCIALQAIQMHGPEHARSLEQTTMERRLCEADSAAFLPVGQCRVVCYR